MPKPRRPKTRTWTLAADFGWMLLTGTLLLGGGGYWLDNRLGSGQPSLTIVGILVGVAVSFSSLFRRLKKVEFLEKQARAREKQGESQAQPERQDPPG